MPIEFELQTLRTTLEVGIDLSEAKKTRILKLNRLDEMRLEALQHTKLIHNQMKLCHDNHIISR